MSPYRKFGRRQLKTTMLISTLLLLPCILLIRLLPLLPTSTIHCTLGLSFINLKSDDIPSCSPCFNPATDNITTRTNLTDTGEGFWWMCLTTVHHEIFQSGTFNSRHFLPNDDCHPGQLLHLLLCASLGPWTLVSLWGWEAFIVLTMLWMMMILIMMMNHVDYDQNASVNVSSDFSHF